MQAEMQQATPVLISLSSFGSAETRRHGQLWFTHLAHSAGADGIEVRGELLVNPSTELPALATAARDLSLRLVYSSPERLWRDDAALDHNALLRALDYAHQLGAQRLKMSIGAFGPGSEKSLDALRQHLAASPIELLIENDQTPSAGTLPALQTFFDMARHHDLPLGMTFDMGNWHWVGECPLQAALALAPLVRYVHCKGVQRQPAQWVAVPLAQSAAPWRVLLRAMPTNLPWAIEYPLIGDDLLAVTRHEIALLKHIASTIGTTV